MWFRSCFKLLSKRRFRMTANNSAVAPDSLSQFLLGNKQRYLAAINEGSGRDWTVVMGNEAGDLDSIASAIAYAWFASNVQNTPTVALVQTPRADLKLRAENLHAAELASLTPTMDEVLCIDDVPRSVPFPSNKFALVDHNRLLPRYLEDNPDAKVVAIIDHHDDEGLYHDTANPRIIVVPNGSCTSLIGRLIHDALPNGRIPPELATLLVCGTLIDTGGLKRGGKAEQADRDAAAFLIPQSTLATSFTQTNLFVTSETPKWEDVEPVKQLTETLFEKKQSVSHLSTTDLLRRDYKDYSLNPSWAFGKAHISVGLSTVPLGLKSWIPRDGEQFWISADKWMEERNLDVLGILTSFRGPKDGKHKRQVLFIIRTDPQKGDESELDSRLWRGLEGSEELELKERDLGEYENGESSVGSRIAKAYKQGNVKATRKVIAPLVRRIIEE